MRGVRRPRRPARIRPARRYLGLLLWGLTLSLTAALLALGPAAPALEAARAGVGARLDLARHLRDATGGGAAPDFALSLFDGGTFRPAEHRGTVVVVNFWASWCPPCRREAPRFAAAADAYRDRGVVFVGVDFQDREGDARDFLREFDLRYPNGPDPGGDIARTYGVSGLPATVVIDRQGRIRRRWLGEITGAQLTGFIEETLR